MVIIRIIPYIQGKSLKNTQDLTRTAVSKERHIFPLLFPFYFLCSLILWYPKYSIANNDPYENYNVVDANNTGKNKKANTNMATLHTDTKTADRKKNFYFLDYVRIIFYAVFIFHIKKTL